MVSRYLSGTFKSLNPQNYKKSIKWLIPNWTNTAIIWGVVCDKRKFEPSLLFCTYPRMLPVGVLLFQDPKFNLLSSTTTETVCLFTESQGFFETAHALTRPLFRDALKLHLKWLWLGNWSHHINRVLCLLCLFSMGYGLICEHCCIAAILEQWAPPDIGFVPSYPKYSPANFLHIWLHCKT